MSKDEKRISNNIRQIINDAQNFDKKAFSMIFDSYYDQIYKYAYLKTGRREDAEDIAQNTFVGALKNIKTFSWKNSEHDFTGWLFRIAHNHIVNFYRKKFNIKTNSLDECNDIHSKESVTEEIEKLCDIDELKYAINEISASQRKVITLRFLSQKSISQTALALNKSNGAVKSLQVRALTSMKKILGEMK